jgi:hypothetical protein
MMMMMMMNAAVVLYSKIFYIPPALVVWRLATSQTGTLATGLVSQGHWQIGLSLG